MEEETNFIEIFKILWKKKLIIILVTLSFIVMGGYYSIQIKVPKYKSTTTLLLAQNSSAEMQGVENEITQTDISLNQKLVSTYSVLVKSKSVLDQVLENLNMDRSLEEELKKSIEVKAVEDTQVIEITYINEDSNMAYKVASELANVFCKKIVEIYNINNVYIVDKAEIAEEPYNINHIKTIIIFAIIGVGLSCMTVFTISLLDTTVKTQEDVENSTGLVVLAQVPEIRSGGKEK